MLEKREVNEVRVKGNEVRVGYIKRGMKKEVKAVMAARSS